MGEGQLISWVWEGEMGKGRHLLLLRNGLWDPRWEDWWTWLREDGMSGCGAQGGVDGGRGLNICWLFR